MSRRRAWIPALIAAWALLAPSMPLAVADSPSATTPAADEARVAADLALDQAKQAVGSGDSGSEITNVLREAYVASLGLTTAAGAEVRAELAAAVLDEPFRAEQGESLRATAPVRDTNCGSGEPSEFDAFCVHWLDGGADAPDLTDEYPDNGIPDYVDEVRAALLHVAARESNALGFNEPLPDIAEPSKPELANPTDQIDIYIADSGSDGQYGYCSPLESDEGATRYNTSGFCVFDNDYSPEQFGSRSTPLDNLRVTAAHEWMHVIQWSYDVNEDAWFQEATAAWVEDEVYDDVDDNLQYLSRGPLAQPRQPLTRASGLAIYASWIYLRFLSETFGPELLVEAWEASSSRKGNRGTYAYAALTQVIEQRTKPGNAQRVLAKFYAANLFPKLSYEEGDLYKATTPAAKRTLSPRDNRRVSTTLKKLSSRTDRYIPKSTSAGSRLSIRVAAQPKPGSRVIAVVKTAGGVDLAFVKLNSRGKGSLRVPFGPEVKNVNVVAVNAKDAGSRTIAHRVAVLPG